MFGVRSVSANKTTLDPYFNNVTLLTHCDGTNGSTSFVDNSSSANTITSVGGASVSTSVFKYGTGSASFSGTNMLSVANGPWSKFGSGNFTVECWINPTTVRTSGSWAASVLIDNFISNSAVDRGWGFYMLSADTTSSYGLGFAWSSDGSNTASVSVDYTWATGTWYHVAVCRDGNILRFFVNGVQVGANQNITVSIYNNTKATSVGDFEEGSWTGTWGYNGYIDDIRVTKGVARYVSNFTPPAAAFPNS